MYITYKVSRKICTVLTDNQIISPENSKFYLYCFDFALDNLLFNAILLVLGVLMSVPLQAAIYIVTMVPVKMFAGGAHANSRIKCSVISFSVFLSILYITNYLAANMSQEMINWIFFLSIPLALFMTPVDTRNKRIPVCQRRRYKQKCMICCLFLIAIYAIIQYYKCRELYCLMAICMVATVLNQIIGILINVRIKEENHVKPKYSNMR